MIYFTFDFGSVYIDSNKSLRNNTTSPLLLIANTSFQYSCKNIFKRKLIHKESTCLSKHFPFKIQKQPLNGVR